MNRHPFSEDEFDPFVTTAISKALQVAGPHLDRDDLEQVVRLTMLESASLLASMKLRRPRDQARIKILRALRSELETLDDRSVARVDLDSLESEMELELGRWSDDLSLVWDGEISDEATAKQETRAHVRSVVEGMEAETAEVVRLRYGLDSDDELTPLDVANVLNETPEMVLSHLWAAEKLFRHFSQDGRHRRLTPMTAFEFEAFYELGDLAWYDLRHLDLNNANLSNCDLSHAVLTGSNLWGTNFEGSVLANANLWGAQLASASFEGAQMPGVNLERASLNQARLTGSTISEANLWGADLGGSVLDHADLSGSDLKNTNLASADLTRTDLRGVDLRGADLRGCKLVGADLLGADLRGAELGNADIRWADLRNSDLRWVNVAATDTTGVSMQGAVRSPKTLRVFATFAPPPTRRQAG